MHFDASLHFSSVLYIFYDKIELQKRIKNAHTHTVQIKSELIVFLCCHMTIVYSLVPVTFHDTCFAANFCDFVAKIDQL